MLARPPSDRGAIQSRLALTLSVLLLLSMSWTVRATKKARAGSAGLKEHLVGNWKMISRVVRHADGTSNPDPNFGPEYPIGYIMYDTTGHMAVQFMGLNRPNNHSSLGYDAYFGTYSVDENANPPTVTHHIEGSLNPASVGKNVVRDLLLGGDRMSLVVHTETPDVNVNSFVRVK